MYDEDLLSHILTGEGIRTYPQDLRQLPAAELQRLFAFASSGKINATRVIKNLIWQAYTAIRDGQRAPRAGNLRSFWYTDIRPVQGVRPPHAGPGRGVVRHIHHVCPGAVHDEPQGLRPPAIGAAHVDDPQIGWRVVLQRAGAQRPRDAAPC